MKAVIGARPTAMRQTAAGHTAVLSDGNRRIAVVRSPLAQRTATGSIGANRLADLRRKQPSDSRRGQADPASRRNRPQAAHRFADLCLESRRSMPAATMAASHQPEPLPPMIQALSFENGNGWRVGCDAKCSNGLPGGPNAPLVFATRGREGKEPRQPRASIARAGASAIALLRADQVIR